MTDKSNNSHSYIAREHPEYVEARQIRLQYGDLYTGGSAFQKNASSYLIQRQKEPVQIYNERLSRVFYENYAGSIIDWFTATLFRREPVIQFDGLNQFSRLFFDDFTGDCDRRGTTLTEFYRRQFTQTLVHGKSFIAIDFPRVNGPVLSRAHEDLAGISRAYLVPYAKDDVINWSYDDAGVLEWIVIRTSQLKQAGVRGDGWKQQTRWIYYDREQYEIYFSEGGPSSGSNLPQLVASGRHALSEFRRVPVFELAVSDGLWLMNKIARLQMEHFNKSNALAWALTMGLFATPVVYSDKEFTQTTGESYYIQLGSQDRFGWTEPEGHVYQIASDNLVRLKEEMYRVCYLLGQAGARSDSQAAQSGLSKAYDFSVTQEILRAYGDVVKDSMRTILSSVADARHDDVIVDVSGVDEFDIQDVGTELQDAQTLLSMNIPSETVRRQLFKKIALKYFCDSRQSIKTQIAAEIDQAFDDRV